MKWRDKLSDMQLDVLQEIGNIGAGNAATSLSNMIGKTVDIEVPHAQIVDLSDLYKVLDQPEEITAATVVGIKGDAPGKMLMIFPSQAAKKLISFLIGQEPEDLTSLDEMGQSVLKEIGNIMCSSYIIALSNFTSLFLESDVPMLVVDMLGAIIAETSIQAAEEYDDVIMVENLLNISEEGDVKGFLMLFPEGESLDKIFSKLGIQ
ncbi:CheY-P phosphatase CheC [Mesoaciditoga sp.]